MTTTPSTTFVVSLLIITLLAPVMSFSSMTHLSNINQRQTTLKMSIESTSLQAEAARRSKAPSSYQKRKTQWIGQSLNYYNTVMREEERKTRGQIKLERNRKTLVEQRRTNLVTAQRLYFARQKIKTGSLHQAERIYRNLIRELMADEDESCYHAQLAVSTLLLSLLLQRQGDIDETRKTFLNFFRIISKDEENGHKECSCSAKVMQAFALFEMKQKNEKKSYSLATIAVQMDPKLAPVLQWKQFRDAREKIHPSSPLLNY